MVPTDQLTDASNDDGILLPPSEQPNMQLPMPKSIYAGTYGLGSTVEQSTELNLRPASSMQSL